MSRGTETISITAAGGVFQKAVDVTVAGEAGLSGGSVTDPVAAIVGLNYRAVAVA